MLDSSALEYYSSFIWPVFLLSTLFTILLCTAPTTYDPYTADRQARAQYAASNASSKGKIPSFKPKKKVSVQVVVLGDIGRSPRMQYHAMSIASHGGSVDLIGYQESDVHPDIAANPEITIVPLSPAPKVLQTSNKLLFLLVAPLKVMWQTWSLFYALGYRTKPSEWMMVQNPPSIPTLAIAIFVCFVRNTKLLIDWHNFGYSILALRLGSSHPLVLISKSYEMILARAATAHFAVTNAMCRVLKEQCGITAVPLHDRPASHFQPLSQDQQSAFLERLEQTSQYADDLKSGRWKLIVSSTSWTADEDFSILLDALASYSTRAAENTKLPKIIAIITGKGPQKELYLSKIRTLNQEKKMLNVLILTAWLSAEDYALLLGSSDLGVSLHTSSSGVDLPMKVVDMFGTGLPVVGWGKFEAWPELVKEDVNGKGFESADELSVLLVELFGDDGSKLRKLREGAMKECGRRWDAEWNPVAEKVLRLNL